MASATLVDLLASLGRDLGRLLSTSRGGGVDSQQIQSWLAEAEAVHQAGRLDEAMALYQRVLGERSAHPVALRGVREVARAAGRAAEAIDAQQRLVSATVSHERAAEAQRLATLHYEQAWEDLRAGRPAAAVPHLKSALRWARDFLPATVALGDTQTLLGERRDAVRTWERAVEGQPSLPVLARLERAYREEGRPTRMIALYRDAITRAPDDLALAVALGRVYLELEMLDEAADQLEKVEVRAPDLPIVHAYLAAVFERRGDLGEACTEYRRSLQLARLLEWPHRCEGCQATNAGWQDQCPTCRRWNTLRPAQS
ncbi:MAG: tetratricopeptide repeat protein [Candidatus Rokuibacteriota bacterium]